MGDMDMTGQLEGISFCISGVMSNLEKKDEFDITFSTVKVRLEILEDLWEQYKEKHNDLRQHCMQIGGIEDFPHFFENRYGTTENDYLYIKERLLTLMEALHRKEVTAGGSKPILPKIKLPTFHGHYSEWSSFSNFFKSLVIEQTSLTEVERLSYLKECLKGEAEEILRDVSIPNIKFQWAWDMLKERYDNPRLLVQDQLLKLFNLPVVVKKSAKDLGALLNNTFAVVARLSEVGRPVQSSADWLVHLTVKKLDHETRLKWETSIENPKELPSLDQLRKFLDLQVRALESVEQYHDEDKRSSTGKRVRQSSTCATKICHLCKNNHYIGHCAEYLERSLEERRAVVDLLSLCLNCLRMHDLTACDTERRCQKCANKHHTSLHQPTRIRQ